MFTEETELIDLLIGLPQSENPYLVSIAYLRKAATVSLAFGCVFSP